jgi:hypothetical protein
LSNGGLLNIKVLYLENYLDSEEKSTFVKKGIGKLHAKLQGFYLLNGLLSAFRYLTVYLTPISPFQALWRLHDKEKFSYTSTRGILVRKLDHNFHPQSAEMG